MKGRRKSSKRVPRAKGSRKSSRVFYVGGTRL